MQGGNIREGKFRKLSQGIAKCRAKKWAVIRRKEVLDQELFFFFKLEISEHGYKLV